MSVYFVESSVAKVQYRQAYKINRRINLCHCISVHKSQYKEYPDNQGIPSIVFSFSNGKQLEWRYSRSQESLRNKDFDNVSKIQIKG